MREDPRGNARRRVGDDRSRTTTATRRTPPTPRGPQPSNRERRRRPRANDPVALSGEDGADEHDAECGRPGHDAAVALHERPTDQHAHRDGVGNRVAQGRDELGTPSFEVEGHHRERERQDHRHRHREDGAALIEHSAHCGRHRHADRRGEQKQDPDGPAVARDGVGRPGELGPGQPEQPEHQRRRMRDRRRAPPAVKSSSRSGTTIPRMPRKSSGRAPLQSRCADRHVQFEAVRRRVVRERQRRGP